MGLLSPDFLLLFHNASTSYQLYSRDLWERLWINPWTDIQNTGRKTRTRFLDSYWNPETKLYFTESNESWVPMSPSLCRLPVPLARSHLIHAESSHLWIQKSSTHGRRISYGNLRRSRWDVSSANCWVGESVTAKRAEQDRGVGRKAKKSHSSNRGNSSSFPWWRLSRHFWMPGFQQTTWRPP